MKLIIEFEDTKITLSVGAEGVTIDAPPSVEEETRQTTLSEAQWEAYAKGREDERAHWNERFKGVLLENEGCTIFEAAGALVQHEEFPRFKDLVALEAEYAEHNTDPEGRSLGDILGEINLPPKVDPVTGNIAGWVKTYRTERRKRALEAQPRAQCVSSCCGTEGARTRDGSCWGCR